MKEKEIHGKTFQEPEVADILAATDLGTDHTVDDWPWGRKQKCFMHFYVESNKRGERYVKQSTFKGRVNKPKTATYATRVKLIEIDGKMGHVSQSNYGGMFSIDIEDGKYLSKTFYDDEAKVLINHFFYEEN